MITELADKYGQSAARVILRWHIEHGFCAIPKSVKPERIAENFDVFDFTLQADEVAAIDALDIGVRGDLVQQGKIRYIGSSSFSAGEIVEAHWAARARNLQRFRTEQPPYSLLVRGIELDVLPTAQRHGMGILTYSPLAGGWLSGSWTADSSPTSPARQRLAARFDMSLPENQRKLEATEQLAKVGDDAGLSLIELAIAFVVNHPAVTSAIIGPRKMEQLDSQLPAADVALDESALDRIDEIIRPGVNLNPADTSYGDQILQPALRRR